MQSTALEYLLGAYFHQDFDLDGTADEVVDDFVRSDPDDARRVPDEIDDLLRIHPVDAELAAYVESTGCEYFADPKQGGYRAWLGSIAERIRSIT